MSNDNEDKSPKKVTDIDAATDNIQNAVEAFAARWISMPRFGVGVEVMDQRQLRDAMGLRATIDVGDPWPKAEKLLYEYGFRWHWLGAQRVMYLKERDDCVQDTGWCDPEEITDEM